MLPATRRQTARAGPQLQESRERLRPPQLGTSAWARRAAVGPVIPPTESGEDFVSDRSRVSRDGIDPVIFINQIDEETRANKRGVDLRYVKDTQVHRHSTEQRHGSAADPAGADATHRAEPTIGITDGHGREAPRS